MCSSAEQQLSALLTSSIHNSPSLLCWSCSTEGSWDLALKALLACSRVDTVMWRDPNTHEQVPRSIYCNFRHQQPLKSGKLKDLIITQKFLGIAVMPVRDSQNAKYTLLIPFEMWLLGYKAMKEIVTAQSLFCTVTLHLSLLRQNFSHTSSKANVTHFSLSQGPCLVT